MLPGGAQRRFFNRLFYLESASEVLQRPISAFSHLSISFDMSSMTTRGVLLRDLYFGRLARKSSIPVSGFSFFNYFRGGNFALLSTGTVYNKQLTILPK